MKHSSTLKIPWFTDSLCLLDALRGGYNTRTSDVGGFTGFSLGLGVQHKDLTVDYAFLPFGDVGTTHWITLGYKMGAGK